jgi:hypothetical protein
MKISAAILFLSASIASISAFSAVAPPSKSASSSTGTPEPLVDRSMKGIDDESTFDPTSGDNAALSRNNNGDVWVAQVCLLSMCLSLFSRWVLKGIFFFFCTASTPSSQPQVTSYA